MSTITSLKFAVESSWDGSGIDQAVAAISSLKADIESMSDGRIKLQVELEGAEQVKAKVDEISRNQEAVIRATADTTEAKAKIEEVSKDQLVLFDVDADTTEAKAKIDEAAHRRDVDLDVNEHGASSVMAKIMAIKALAHDIDINIDTSGAQSALSKVGGLLSNHIVLVGALTAALTGLGAVAAMVGGALLTALGGGVLIAGAAITAMYKHQTEQISDNIRMQKAQADTADNQVAKAFQNVAQVAEQGSRSIRQAQEGVASAQQNVTQVSTQGAQQIANANRAVQDSQQKIQETAREGARSIEQANRQSVQANRQLIQSQQAVADAYQNAQRSLENLQMQQSQSGDNIKAAQLAVRRAEINVQQGPQAGSKTPELDQEEAVNQLALAQDHLRDTILRAQQTNEDYNKAQAKGIEGSDQVVQAKQRESDAQQRAADAQQNVQDVTQKAAENNAKAQQQLVDNVQKAAQAQQTAAQNNAKAQQEATQAMERLADQQQIAAENNAKAQQELANAQIGAADAHRQLDAAMAKMNTTGMQLLSTLNDIVKPLQGPLKEGMNSLMSQLRDMTPQLQGMFAAAGPLVQPFVNTITGATRAAIPGFTSALGGMRDMMPGLQSGMQTLGGATGQMMATLGQDAKNLGQIAHDFGQNFGDFINIWADFVKKTGPDAAATFDHMGRGINSFTGGFLSGTAGFEHNARPDEGKKGGIESTFDAFGDVSKRALPGAGTMAKGIGAGVSGIMQPLSGPVGDALGQIGEQVGKTAEAGAPGLQALATAIGQIVTALTPLIPLIGAFTQGMGSGFAMTLSALAPVIKIVADALGAMAKFLQPLAPVITAIGVAFGVYRTAVMVATIATGAFNLVMSANPIVLVGIAIAALVAGIIYLATKTQFFQTVWKTAWAAMTTLFKPVVDFVEGVIHWFEHLYDVLLGHSIIPDIVNGLKKWFGFIGDIVHMVAEFAQAIARVWSDCWNAIKDVSKAIWDWIRARWDDFWTGIKVVWDFWSALIKKVWGDFWGGIRDVASGIWGGIQKGWDTFADGLKKGFEWIRDRAKDIWDGMKEIFAKPINFVFNAMSDTVGKVIPALKFDHDPVKLASGGVVPGNGHPRADDVPAMLSSKEFVVNADAAQKHMGLLNHINGGGVLTPAPVSLVNNFAPDGPQKLADGGEVKGPNGQPSSDKAVSEALGWAQSQSGREYNADGWLDCSGLASGIYDVIKGHSPQREFTTVSNFESLGFKRGSGGMFEIGVLPEPGDAGHMAVTLDGHPIESAGGGKGIQVDGGAWGADNSYFSDHYYLPGDQFSPQFFGKGWDGESSGDKGFFGKIAGAFSGVVNRARGLVSEAFIKLTNPILSAIPSPFPGTGLPAGAVVKDFATKGRDEIANFMRGHEKSQGAGGLGGPMGGVIPEGEHLKIIQEALKLNGIDPNDEHWLKGMNTLIGRESGWNAGAINLEDSNAAKGTPSKGLAQVIDPTFQAYKIPGHDDIWAPVDNVAASISYIRATQGDISNVQQANENMAPKGYATGTTNADPGWAVVGEAGPELVQFKGGEQVMSNQDTQKMLQNLQGVVSQHSQSFQNALTSPIDQFGQDIGLGSITSGSGFIPQLIKQSIDYAGQLNGWTPPAGSLLGNALGIKEGNGGGLANQDPNALAQQEPGTGVLDNPSSAPQANANAGVDAQAQALKDGKLPSPTPAAAPMVGGDLHLHSQGKDPVKDWFDRLHLHSNGFDPLG